MSNFLGLTKSSLLNQAAHLREPAIETCLAAYTDELKRCDENIKKNIKLRRHYQDDVRKRAGNEIEADVKKAEECRKKMEKLETQLREFK